MARRSEESGAKPLEPQGDATVHVHVSRRIAIGLGVVLLAPWILLAIWAVKPENAPLQQPQEAVAGAVVANGRTEPSTSGPWGQLEYTRIAIELPEEFVFVPPSTDDRPIRWFFKGYTEDQVVALFESVNLEDSLLVRLKAAPYEPAPDGVWVTPGDEVILQLKPEARAKLYSILIGFQENSLFIDPFCYRPALLDERIERSGLSDRSLKLFKSLLYHHGPSLLLFADVEPALRQIADETEQRRFVKTISRKTTLLAKLKITPDCSVRELVAYWGVGGRSKDLEPLLDSLRRVEGGTMVDLLHLLPRFVRQRLYTYPRAVDPGTVAKQDCFWSAFNVFNDEPDDRFADMNYAAEMLQQDYYHIVSPSQLGDLIFLATDDGTAVHAASYIADDIVFTKNGAMYTQPWILMPLDDMVAIYSIPYPADRPLKVHYYRRKAL